MDDKSTKTVTAQEVEKLVLSMPLHTIIRMRLEPMLKKLDGSGTALMDVVLQHVEKALITAALEHCGGNAVKTASLLGLHRNTLRAKCRELGIEAKEFKSRRPGR